MALVNSTYAGKAAYPYMSCAILELNSLSNNSLTIRQNEKGTMVLRHGALSNGLEQAACGWSATKPVLQDRVVVLSNLMIVNEICKEDYFNSWEAAQMGDSSWRNTPTDLANWLTPQLLATGVAELEVMIWQGTGVAPQFLGFEPQITAAFVAAAAGDTPVSAGVGEAVSADTIIGLLSAVVDATSPEVKSQADFEIICSFTAYEAYKAALGAFDSITPLWDPMRPITFNGYAVRRGNGMTADVIIASTVSNLVFGTALLSDTTSVRMEEREMEEDIRFKAKFDAAVGVGCFADITTLNVPIA